jgi:uncharacterized membrane protein
MAFFVVVCAILLIILWVKVHNSSRRQGDLTTRFILLEQRLSAIEGKLQNLQGAPKKPPEDDPAKAEPVKPPSAEVHPADKVPTTPPSAPKVETPPVPATQTAPRQTPPPRPSSIPPPVMQPAPWKLPKLDWESLVGVKLFSWIAGIALLLGAVLFFQYSKSQGWITPEVQFVMGLLLGLGLLVVCELKAARKYPITANAMDASAIAILYATFFAARARWDLIGALPAFAFMILLTVIAVLLSIRRDSIFIALLGLFGGFATPALLSTGENKPIPLFIYILLLNAGLSWIAAKKKWPLLTTLSLIFTVFYQWGWVMKFLTASQLPIAIGIFLAFPILAFISLALGRKEDTQKSWLSLYGQASNWSALLPLLFALYMAAVPEYGQHYGLLFSFLILLDIGLFAIAAARGPETLHIAGGVSTILVTAIWLASSYTSDSWPEVLGFIALLALFYLVAPFIAQYFRRSFTGMGRKAAYTVPLLLFIFPCLAAMEPECSSPGLLFGTLFLIVAGVSVYAIISKDGPAYFIAAFFALIAEAVWSAKHLTPERLYSGLAIYAIFGLLYIGVPIAARRWDKTLQPERAGAGLLLVSLALLLFLAVGPIATTAIWGLALLLLIINAGLFWEVSACKFPVFAIAGMVLSWIILGVMWASASLAAILMPALVVMAGFALLVLAGNIWMHQKAEGANAALLANGLYLGLAGHIFLIAIAAQRSLSVPPWPMLGILLVLDLAIGAAALHLKRNELHQAAMAASAFILIVWVITAGAAPWPTVAIFSAGALALIAFVWIYLAHHIGIDPVPFSITTQVTLVLAQFVARFAAMQTGAPHVVFLLVAHLIFLIAFLSLDWVRKNHVSTLIAVFSSAIAVTTWALQHSNPGYWAQLLLFAAPIYLVFIGYPLLLGRRAGRSLYPYLAAVLAGIPFFFQARHSIIQAGWGEAIGILPLAQALLLALLLMRLLKIEPRGQRSLGRLALIAGAGLAFITVAIPLQLEKEWITLGWALEGVALAWLVNKIPHKGLLFASSGLFAAVFIRLALNPAILDYQPRAGMRIWNWYLYTYLIASAALIGGGWLLSKAKISLSSYWPRIVKLFQAGGVLLLFLLLNIEIADFYSTGSTITFRFTATLAQDLTYTLGWALFAVVLLAAGIVIRSQPARISALALLTVTIFKCFLHDLYRLGGLYRVGSLVSLAICLALVALVLQRFILSVRKEGE